MARLAARVAPRGARRMDSAPRTGTLAELDRHKRALLVTYRRTGVAVPTPVWVARAGEEIYVRTERASGKVKRLRRQPRVLIAPSTAWGKPLGPPLEAAAAVLADAEEEDAAERALAARYGPGRELFERAMDSMRVDMCYLRVTPRAWQSPEAPRRS